MKNSGKKMLYFNFHLLFTFRDPELMVSPRYGRNEQPAVKSAGIYD